MQRGLEETHPVGDVMDCCIIAIRCGSRNKPEARESDCTLRPGESGVALFEQACRSEASQLATAIAIKVDMLSTSLGVDQPEQEQSCMTWHVLGLFVQSTYPLVLTLSSLR